LCKNFLHRVTSPYKFPIYDHGNKAKNTRNSVKTLSKFQGFWNLIPSQSKLSLQDFKWSSNNSHKETLFKKISKFNQRSFNWK
jgi:hypothetical protein